MTSPYDDPRAGRGPSGSTSRPNRPRRGVPPVDPLKLLAEEFPSLLAGALASFAPGEGPGLSAFDFNPHGFTPLSETLHDGDDVLIRLELPGVKLEDISVELNDNRIIVSGEKREAKLEEKQVRKLREIRYGSFKRTYPVPVKTTEESVAASYDEGILTIRVRSALKKPEGIKISVAGQETPEE